ncbi:discoidin domain-containing protein [Anaerocolumna xylanovorans]|nr:discoidin domain-containing protein [Anaerocolumna xylanovorans]
MAKFCTECGAQMKEEDIYCASCGTRRRSSISMVTENQSIPEVISYKPKKKIPFWLCIFVIIAVGAGAYYMYTNRSTPEKTISKFEKSFNELDVSEMIECFEPSAQALYKGTMALISGLSGMDANTILERALGYADIVIDEKQPQINFVVLSVDYKSKNTAEVNVECSYYSDGRRESSTEIIDMVKVKGKWYISTSWFLDTDTDEEEILEENNKEDDNVDVNTAEDTNADEDMDDAAEETGNSIADSDTEDSDTYETADEANLAEAIEDSEFIDNSIIRSVSISSELAPQTDSNGANDYIGENALDGNSDTAWVEGAAGNGDGEWLQLDLDGAHVVNGIEINNGYRKTQDLYLKNGRANEIRIYFSDNTYEDFTLTDDFSTVNRLDFSTEHLTNYIKVQILSVFEGSKYQDTGISDIFLY